MRAQTFVWLLPFRIEEISFDDCERSVCSFTVCTEKNFKEVRKIIEDD